MRLMWYDAFVNVYACAQAWITTLKHGHPRVACSQLFSRATSFNQDLSAWNVARVANFFGIFSYANLSSSNKRCVYDAWGSTFQTYDFQNNNGFSNGVCTIAVTPTSFSPLNTPASRGAAITILGAGFGAVDASPSAYISGQPCATASWTSATQLVCSASAPTVAGGALPSVRSSPCPDDG
jgi:hypothetical protein